MSVPKLRFKADNGSEYPEWEEKQMKDVCSSFEYGMNVAAVKFDGVHKYLRITDIDDDTHQYKADDIVSPNSELDEKYLVKIGDIFFARTGASVGKTYCYDIKDGTMYFAGFLIRGEVKPDYDYRYIFLQTLTERYNKWVKVMSARSGQPGINANEYASYLFPCASDINEQQKISDFFSTLDQIIDKTQAEVDAWEKQKQGMMQKLFSQEIRFKADDGSEYPDWESQKFSSIYKCVSEKNSGEFGLDKIISVANMYFKVDATVTNDEYMKTYNIFRIGDIAFEGNKSKSFKYGRFVENDIGDGIVSHVFAVFRPVRNDHNVEYWKYAINNESIMGRILSKCTKKTTMMTNLVTEDFLRQEISCPCQAEQQKIADCLSAFDSVINKIKQELEAYKQLKKGLMQQMFV